VRGAGPPTPHTAELAVDADDDAEDLRGPPVALRHEDRRHRRVLGLETNVITLREIALAGRLVTHEGHDDVAAARLDLLAHEHVVAVVDAGVDHRLSDDA
jgi:hypothetical protein